MRKARPRGTVRCIVFVASAALVGLMLAQGMQVRRHPIYPDRMVVPDVQVSSSQLRELLGHREFIFVASLVFLASPTGSLQTYTSDATWNNSINTVETVAAGGGGGGSNGTSPTAGGGGGGGGAYSRINNFTFASPGVTTASYEIGTGGAGGIGTGNGTAGGATWFDGTALVSCSVGAGAGTGGKSDFNGRGAGFGGFSSDGTGTFKRAGGAGGASAGSGGGAGGPNGSGAIGTSPTGGAGDGNTVPGGAGSTMGNHGTEFDATHGIGSGAGATLFAGADGNPGGNYGGGGSSGIAAISTLQNGGPGGQGLVVLTWTPPMGDRDWSDDTLVRSMNIVRATPYH